MRVRTGFVSNSSSSSFLIFGRGFSSEGELILALGISEQEAEEKYLDADGKEALEEVLGKDRFKELLTDNGIKFIRGADDDVYVGASWDTVRGDETGNQFRERVQQVLNQIFPDKQECKTEKEAWYNG